jgi:hypothetical protein
MADRLLGVGVLDFSESVESASREGYGGFFTSQVYGTCDGIPALVDIESGPAVDDDGNYEPGPLVLCGVHARRTLLAVSLGFVVALAWLEQGDGELSGAGLDGSFSSGDLESLVIKFRAREKAGKQGVVQLARSIVGDARMEFA